MALSLEERQELLCPLIHISAIALFPFAPSEPRESSSGLRVQDFGHLVENLKALPELL